MSQIEMTPAEFAAFQAGRRKELWSLLGELPWGHKPGPATVLATEKHDGYTLERLVLDLHAPPACFTSTGMAACMTWARNNS
jgi:hypothetical protein